MGDDRVVEPAFDVAHVYTTSGWGFAPRRLAATRAGRIHGRRRSARGRMWRSCTIPQIDVDAAATERMLDLTHDLFDGLLEVRLRTGLVVDAGHDLDTGRTCAGCRQLMYDMIDEPDLVHDLMAILRDGTLAVLDSLEARDLLA